MSADASLARIIDHWLGGSNHTPVDAAAAADLSGRYPGAPAYFQAQRAFQRDALGPLSEGGIHQFMLFEAGFPTAGHAHEQLPDAKVYYSDNDFDVVQPGAGLLAAYRRRVRYQTLDPTNLEDLEDLEFSPILDTEAPIGIVLIGAAERSDDETLALVLKNFFQFSAPGSALVMTHATPEAGDYAAFFSEWSKAFQARDGASLNALSGEWSFDFAQVEGAPLIGGIARK